MTDEGRAGWLRLVARFEGSASLGPHLRPSRDRPGDFQGVTGPISRNIRTAIFPQPPIRAALPPQRLPGQEIGAGFDSMRTIRGCCMPRRHVNTPDIHAGRFSAVSLRFRDGRSPEGQPPAARACKMGRHAAAGHPATARPPYGPVWTTAIAFPPSTIPLLTSTLTSTRRFSARPDRVALSATGFVAPKPNGVMTRRSGT